LSDPWGATREVSAEAFHTLRMRTIFEHHKYDPQIGDTAILTNYPLLLKASAWREIAPLAEQLTQELLAAERELAQKPHLHKALGIPSSIARLWSKGLSRQQPDVRVMRFDFHYTTEGWRISECNCDTPGGYNEAVGFTSLMQGHFPGSRLAGNPAHELAQGIAASVGAEAHVAMIYPTAFVEDQQILRFLRPYLEDCGLITHLASPTHLRWDKGKVWLHDQQQRHEIRYLLRYFPAEWLPNIGRSAPWQDLFTQVNLPASNPTTALLPQSKRFPLVWDNLSTPMTTWRALLPTTKDLRQIPQSQWREWVLKPMYGRFGTDIAIPGVADDKLWASVLKSARRNPEEWIAQTSFQAIPMQNPYGEAVYPCIGVYTVNGKACGLYGRQNRTSIIDATSRDIAILLIEDEEHDTTGIV
jgi:glutathionylspermidine synthase